MQIAETEHYKTMKLWLYQKMQYGSSTLTSLWNGYADQKLLSQAYEHQQKVQNAGPQHKNRIKH